MPILKFDPIPIPIGCGCTEVCMKCVLVGRAACKGFVGEELSISMRLSLAFMGATVGDVAVGTGEEGAAWKSAKSSSIQ